MVSDVFMVRFSPTAHLLSPVLYELMFVSSLLSRTSVIRERGVRIVNRVRLAPDNRADLACTGEPLGRVRCEEYSVAAPRGNNEPPSLVDYSLELAHSSDCVSLRPTVSNLVY